MSKKGSIAAMVILLVLPTLASANGFNLNGLGSRAQAMGGAFVGVANDFSAVFWNPAGAAGFRKDLFGFCLTDLIPRATYQLEYAIPEAPYVDAKTQTSHYLGGLAAYYKPLSSRVVIGLGISTPSGLGAIWNGEDFMDLTNGDTYSWSSKIGVLSFSPLVAVKLSDAISVGAALNVNHGVFSLKMPGGSADLDGAPVDLGQYEESMAGWGLGATIGVLVAPSDKLSLGLTVRTPSTVSFNGTASVSYPPLGSSDLKRKITWPLWIAGGVSFRPVPRLLLSADVQWTQWSKLDRITTEYLNEAWVDLLDDIIHGAAGAIDVHVLAWKDATQLRFGAEYTANASTVLRAGYYNDPAPAPNHTLNVLWPSHTFNAFSLGIGKTFSELQLDFGLEYLSGNKRTKFDDFPPLILPGDYGMHIIVPSISVSYKF